MSKARLLASPLVSVYALVALIALACALAISTYSVFGHTWDEPEHLAAGIAFLDTGNYPYDAQHPPLARIAMAVGPYLAGARSHGNAGPSGEQEGRDILYDGHYDLYLSLARLGMLPFLVTLLCATWLWGRRLFGEAAGVLATSFVVATPVVIGHAAVAALDIPMVGTTLLALYLLLSWFQERTTARAIAVGIAAGFAAGTKLSSIPFLGCVGVVWFLCAGISSIVARNRQSDSTVVQTNLSAPTLSDQPLFSRTTLLHFTLATLSGTIALIACFGFNLEQLTASFTTLLDHNKNGHLSYFMGDLRRTGWWDFYLVGIAVKTPLPLLLTAIAGSVWLLRRSIRERSWILAASPLAWIVILVFASAYSHINIGVRHVLLVFPLLAINAAAIIVALWRRFESTIARAPLVLLLAWQAWSMAAAHPDYLPYFNELAGAHPEKILIDSDLDWGQDLRRLKHTLHDRRITQFSFVYRGSADLQREGFPSFEFLWPNKRATGWIAVSLLAKATGSEEGGYDWLNAYQPIMRVGKSIDLYYIGTSDKGPGTSQN